MLHNHSRVFKAHHSGLPGHLAVVKVIRMPHHPGRSDNPVIKAADLWMREAKHHPKLTQHVSAERRI